MRINVYKQGRQDAPVRFRKWVRDIIEAQSFCEWYERTFEQKVSYVITR